MEKIDCKKASSASSSSSELGYVPKLGIGRPLSDRCRFFVPAGDALVDFVEVAVFEENDSIDGPVLPVGLFAPLLVETSLVFKSLRCEDDDPPLCFLVWHLEIENNMPLWSVNSVPSTHYRHFTLSCCLN